MTQRKHVILVIRDNMYEVWASLTEICARHELPYYTLSRESYPIKYHDFTLMKIPFKTAIEDQSNK